MPDYHDYKLECVLYDSISRSKMVNISKAIRAKNSCCRGVSSRGNARSTMLSYLYSSLMPSANDFSMEGAEGGGAEGWGICVRKAIGFLRSEMERNGRGNLE